MAPSAHAQHGAHRSAAKTPSGRPVGDVDVEDVFFGDVAAGSHVERTITVTNEGKGLLRFGPVDARDGFARLSGAAAALGAGESTTLTYTLDPPSWRSTRARAARRGH